jgi:hypothetical protein
LSSNPVGVLSPDEAYARWLGDVSDFPLVCVSLPNPETLTIVIEGDRREHPRLVTLVRRMLSVGGWTRSTARRPTLNGCIRWYPYARREAGVDQFDSRSRSRVARRMVSRKLELPPSITMSSEARCGSRRPMVSSTGAPARAPLARSLAGR